MYVQTACPRDRAKGGEELHHALDPIFELCKGCVDFGALVVEIMKAYHMIISWISLE
jgi:hypothetical protein